MDIFKSGELPITISNFTISNVKLRLVLKGIVDKLPIVSGFQVFLLEEPLFEWNYESGVAKLAELPIIEDKIRSSIRTIVQDFVYPNRISKVINLPPDIQKLLQDMCFETLTPSSHEVFSGPPQGVIKVTVVKAKGIKATEMTYDHMKNNANLNPLHPNKFAVSELLPKKGTSSAYCRVGIGNSMKKSETAKRTRNPEWNFEALFPIEYHQGQKIKIWICDKNTSSSGEDKNLDKTCLGRCYEEMDSVWEATHEKGHNGILENWYNLQSGEGKVLVRFQFLPLTKNIPRQLQGIAKTTGVLSLFLGTMTTEYDCMPECYISLDETDQGEQASQNKGLEEEQSHRVRSSKMAGEHRFNDKKYFVIQNVHSIWTSLKIKVWDKNIKDYIGELDLKIKAISGQSKEISYTMKNSYNTLKPPKVNIRHTIYSLEDPSSWIF